MDLFFYFIFCFYSKIYLLNLIFSFFILILFVFLYSKTNIINQYKKEVISFDIFFKKNDINYNNTHITFGLSAIFIAGFNEFIKMNNKGIYDIKLNILILEKVMLNASKKELIILTSALNILDIFFNFFLFIGLSFMFLSTIIFFQKINLVICNELSIYTLLLELKIVILLFFFCFIVAFFINLLYYKYADIISNISIRYNSFINEFVILVIDKFY